MTAIEISSFSYSPFNPEMGRFLSEDSIGFYGLDENLYRYVLNNPINSTDPTGTIGLGGYKGPIFVGILLGAAGVVRQCNIDEKEQEREKIEQRELQKEARQKCLQEVERLNNICSQPHMKNTSSCLAPRRSCNF